MKKLLKEIDKKIATLDRVIDEQYWEQFKKFVEIFDSKAPDDPIDFKSLLLLINKTFGREFRVVTNAVKAKYRARMKEGFTKEDIFNAMTNCKEADFHNENNFQYCTPEFFSREGTLTKWGFKKKQENESTVTDQSPVN